MPRGHTPEHNVLSLLDRIRKRTLSEPVTSTRVTTEISRDEFWLAPRMGLLLPVACSATRGLGADYRKSNPMHYLAVIHPLAQQGKVLN